MRLGIFSVALKRNSEFSDSVDGPGPTFGSQRLYIDGLS